MAKRFADGAKVRILNPGINGVVRKSDDEPTAMGEYWHTIRTEFGEQPEPGCNLKLIPLPVGMQEAPAKTEQKQGHNGEKAESRPTPAKFNLAILEAQKAALVLYTDSKVFQHNNSMELDLSLTDNSVFELFMMERNRELADLDVEIAKARAATGREHGSGASFIAESRVSELRKLTSTEFDFKKLIRLCEELNTAYREECYLATAMLIRGMLDHVPPLFKQSSFKEVANNYGGGGKSFKDTMQYLENAARKIADSHLHMPIRKSETLPAERQVDFGASLDVLLSEIVRITQSK
ncbi:MAG TPA: hypothetical protein VMT20_14435 [Terriglobia bacterium]|nr:hypothetical protein [Terriglobia bacterium]